MGKKKRRSVSSVKQPPLTPPSTSVDSASEPRTSATESLPPVILSECLQALETFQHGNCMKALKKIKQSVSNHRDSPHLHFVEALLHSILAEKAGKDSDKKLKHLNDALQSAELAVDQLRNSIHFALLRIDLLYQSALMTCREWKKVIVLCEDALKIENSTDPGVDMFLEEDEMVNSSKESRIEGEKKQITMYLQASNNIFKAEKLKKLVKKKKEVEEKDSGTPVDVMGMEMPIDVKGMELRRMMIEGIIRDWIVKKQKTSLFSTKKFKGKVEKVEKYKRFWNSRLTSEEKMGFSMVSVEELERHFKSLKCNLGVDFSEAIIFAKKYNTWKYWECCNEKMGDYETYRERSMEFDGSNLDLWKNDFGVREGWIEKILTDEWKPLDSDLGREFILNHFKSLPDSICDPNFTSRMCMNDEKWPYCTDTKREEILQGIYCTFLLLFRNQCLATSHCLWPILYTTEKFEILISLSKVCQPITLKLICFLEASELEQIHSFLKNMADTCGLTENPVKGSFLDNYIKEDPLSDTKGRVGFSTDLSCLLVDELIMRRELDINGVTDCGSVLTSPDNDDIVSWLYEGHMIEEDLESWTSLRDSQSIKVAGISQLIDTEYEHVSKISEGNYALRRRINAVEVVDRIYLEETEKREKCPGYAAQDYANLLRKRREGLKENLTLANIIESEVISHVLEEAAAAEECGAEDEMGLQEPFTQTDSRVRLTLQRLKRHLTETIGLYDAFVLWGTFTIERYQQIIQKMSVYDYQPMIVAVLKSFLQTHLEDLFNKDAKKTSDAVIDDILADLALDAEKSTNRRATVNQKQDSKKNKKKMKKKFRKDKESKATSSGKNFQLHHAEQYENPNAEIVASTAELEPLTATEERLFEERMEYQKKFENEASLSVNVLGAGLINDEADCFINVIIQSLWNLREFRELFISGSEIIHRHIGIPCVVCTLYDIFAVLSTESADNRGEAVAPTSLVIALRTSYHDKNIFQEGQTNDASELLKFILESLHESFNVDFSDSESECKYSGSLDCFNASCFVHRIFGMDHYERMDCFYCHVESRHRKHTSLSHNLNACNLGMMKNKHGNSSFEVLLKLAEMTGQLTCESCGQINHIYRTLWCLPHVFTIVLGWQSADESSKDISTTLSALSTELDISVLFQGYQPDNIYFLVSMVSFSEDRQHYICFIYNHRHEKYVLYDDTTVEVIGSWNDVLAICDTMHLQPRILFYLHKSSVYFGD